MFTVARPFRPLPALALSCALGAVVNGAWAMKPEGGVCVPHLRIVTTESVAPAPTGAQALPPEPITYARAVIAPPLDAHVARLSFVQTGERIRDSHLSVILADVDSLKTVTPLCFDTSLWHEMVEIMSGTARGVASDPTMRRYLSHVFSQCSFVTLRARLDPAAGERPFASLTLGPYHYSVELRSRVLPSRSSNRTQVMNVGTYRARRSLRGFAPGPEFNNPIPGGLTNRGFIKGRVVGIVDANGEHEPLLNMPDPSAQLISGTWHYENQWLTLRLYMSHDRFAAALK